MPRRPRGEGTVVKKLALALFFLWGPWLAEARQQLQQNAVHRHHESPHEGLSLEATTLSQPPGEIETPIDGAIRRKKTLSTGNDDFDDASAIATFAPVEPAVRAQPSRRVSDTAGLSSPQIARSLDDWEVEDFVLLATVDGKLHARDRKTGRELWNVETDQPMVETIYHSRNRSTLEPDYMREDGYLWIVEPSQGGSLFVYIPDGPNPGLINLGLTIKKLVEELAPYADKNLETPVVYNGDKKTTMITFDAATGKVLKWFGAGSALSNGEQSCVRSNGIIDPEAEECSTTGTVTLGRNEYTLGIFGLDTHPIATLKYSEWVPNNYDNDLQRQYDKTLDMKYVYSTHDGNAFGYDLAQGNEASRLFKSKFSSPVARVFDIARPWGAEKADVDLVVLPQPVPPPEDATSASMRKSRIFLNHTEEGSWYAMSGNTYPLVISGPDQAQCDRQDWRQHAPMWENLNQAQLSRALVGLHSIERTKPVLTISAPTLEDRQLETLPGPADVEELEEQSVVDIVSRSFASYFRDLVMNPFFTVGILAFVLLNWKHLGKLVTLDRLSGKSTESKLLEAPMDTQKKPQLAGESVTEEPAPTQTIDIAVPPAKPSVPMKHDIPTIQELPAEEAEAEKLAGVEPPVVADPPTPAKKKTHRGRRGGQKHKKGRNGSQDSQAKSTDDETSVNVLKPSTTVDDTIRDVQKFVSQPEPKLEPDEITAPGNKVDDVSGLILRINGLEVDQRAAIGHGSNGTVVYQGRYDGRDVAIKRMLIQFYDIASQETRLLRESDDHPNVVRYYSQMQSGDFLYICLELAPATLAQVIEGKREEHRALRPADDKVVPGVLYQITCGVQHLHSLRIVHRDLKPQNILVTLDKQGKHRLLVSDFGLCKKLDMEQSSFRATTAHAAGTTGWRAPELLADDDRATIPTTYVESSGHSGTGPLVSADQLPNRRATRSIDIFSLGLVFYFVLTGGLHPFDRDGQFMREINIRNNVHDLSGLDRLGEYAFEARVLIASMIAHEPKERPTAREVLTHPFFWSSKKRLDFLCDVSDHFEREPRDPASPALEALEACAPQISSDFLKPLGKEFVESLGKQRKYTGSRLLDLLRALRNKKNHYEDMSEKLRKEVGPLPDGYLRFWSTKFPNLLMVCWGLVRELQLDDSDRFRDYYAPSMGVGI